MQIPPFVLSQHGILDHIVGSLFIYCEIFHVCLIFKVQQCFVNLLNNFLDLLYDVLYTFFSAQEVLEKITPKPDCAAAIPKVATKSA